MIRILLIALLGMVFVGCATGNLADQNKRGTDPQAVLNRTWQWESTITQTEKIVVPDPERYTILLEADGKAIVRFDCNGGGGQFQISPGKLTFGPLMSTRMACPPDSLDVTFMRNLQRVATFFVENGNLYLELPLDSGTMRFVP